MMFLAVEASHLPNIGNRSEGLLKQTQYPKPLHARFMNYAENKTERVALTRFNE